MLFSISDDPQLTAAGLWQKKWKKATNSHYTETLQLLWQELAHTMTFLKQDIQHQLYFSYHKSAGPWHPQHQVRAATVFPKHLGAGPSCEVRGVHKDHFGARGASEAQQSGLPEQGDSSHRSHITGPRARKEAGSCLQSPSLLSCGGTAKQVIPRV